MQGRFDCAVEAASGVWSKTNQTFSELSLPIENERLRNRVVVAQQERHHFVVRCSERILNTTLFCERRNFFLISWATDV